MKTTLLPAARKLKRVRFFGAAIAMAGLGILIYGGLSLMGIHGQEQYLIILETGLSPEKGRMWVYCLIGASLVLIGIALGLKAGEEAGKKSEI
jgi:hypothetical protein